MAEQAQELTVTNSGQPLVTEIETAEENEVAQAPQSQTPTNVTVTITTAAE